MYCKFLYIVSTVAYQTQVVHRCPHLRLGPFPPSFAALPNSHIQKWLISGCISIEMLFSYQVFVRDIQKWESEVIISRHRRIVNNFFCHEHSNTEGRNGILYNQERQNMEQWNKEHQGTPRKSKKVEHPGTVVKQRSTPEHKQNTPEYQRKINWMPAKTPLNNGTIQNKERLQCFFQKLSTSLSFIEHFQLKVEISYSADINSYFIH